MFESLLNIWKNMLNLLWKFFFVMAQMWGKH